MTPPRFVTRAQWRARAPKRPGLPTNITPGRGGVGIHYEAAAPPASHTLCDDAVRQIQVFHQDTRGWIDIAYTALICPHGYIYEGRGLHKRTAANGTDDANQRYYALCWLGDEKHPPGPAAVQAFRDAIAWCRGDGGAGKEIRPHSVFFNTACPGDTLRSLIRSGQLEPGTTAPPAPVLVTVEARLPVLHRGDSGWAVGVLQALLTAHGATVAVDRDFGPATAKAVAAFKLKRKLGTTARVGEQEWQALLAR